jgi:hypothetical protein
MRYISRRFYLGELISANKEDGFESFQFEDLGLEKADGNTIDLDQSSTLLHVGDGGGSFLSSNY